MWPSGNIHPMNPLTEVERRVLGNLPRYRTEAEFEAVEAEQREAAKHPETWRMRRSLSAQEVAQRLDADDNTPASAKHVVPTLNSLAGRDYCVFLDNDEWAMTELGFETLTGPVHDEEEEEV